MCRDLPRQHGEQPAKILYAGYSNVPFAPINTLVTHVATPQSPSTVISDLQRQGYRHRTPSDIHGCLVNIFGLGVLIMGESGVGKSYLSQCLLARGHQLISDDIVEVERRSDGQVIGVAPLLTFGALLVNHRLFSNVHLHFSLHSLALEKQIHLMVYIGPNDHNKKQKIDGFKLPLWYIAAPHIINVYRAIEAYLQSGINDAQALSGIRNTT